MSQLQSEELVYTGTLTSTRDYVDYEDDAYPNSTKITGLISDERYYNEDAAYGVTDYYSDAEGYIATRILNPVTNEVIEERATNDYGETGVFATNLFNPFDSLTVESLKQEGDEIVVSLTDDELATTAFLLTMYDDVAFSDFTLAVDDDYNIVSAKLEGKFEGQDYYGDKYIDTSSFEFTLSTQEEMGIPDVVKRDETQSNPELDAILKKLAQGNYTLHYEDQEVPEEGEEPTDPTVIDAIFTSQGFIYTRGNSTRGVYETGEGICNVLVEDGKLLAQDGKDTSTKVSDYLPLYNYKACMFDKTGENTYSLASIFGTEDSEYITEMLPAYPFVSGLPESGTYKIEITGEDSCKVTYTTTSFWESVLDEITIDLTDIGSTQWPYAASDFVPIQVPKSWDEIDGAVELLESFSIPVDHLPLDLPDETIVSLTTDFNQHVMFTLPADVTTEEFVESYTALLVEAGWEDVGPNKFKEEEFHYQISSEKTAVISLSQASADNNVMMWLYQPLLPPTPLETFLSNFADGKANYTQKGTLKAYYYDASLTEDGNYSIAAEPYNEELLGTYENTFDDKAALRKTWSDNGGDVTQLFVNEDDETVSHYEKEGEETEYALVENLKYYSDYVDVIPTLADLADSGLDFEEREDGSYRTEKSYPLQVLLGTTGFALPEDEALDFVTIQLDSENKTISVHIESLGGIYYKDKTKTQYAFANYVFDFTIDNVGTTVVDADAAA